jgi:drug/metabolite transporter superfamily protein YnfA
MTLFFWLKKIVHNKKTGRVTLKYGGRL